MQEQKTDSELLSIIQQEKFVAFFDFRKTDDSRQSMLDGLCKIAEPRGGDIRYYSVTLIFDTPSEAKREMAVKTVERLSRNAFRVPMPDVYAVTSVPSSVIAPADHYMHQIDVILKPGSKTTTKEAVNAIAHVLRHAAGLDTELPQWWSDEEAPERTEQESKNLAGRIKAFLGI